MPHVNDRRQDAELIRYTLLDSWIVLVGKTAADNDLLTFVVASGNDWWFHVRGMPGSHVVLQHHSGEDPPRAVLEQSAAIAAYHSKARNAGLTAISCTQVKHVAKPKGAKPGSVQIRREQIFKVRPAVPAST